MAKPKNIIPTRRVEVRLPAPVAFKLDSLLFSEVESRVPYDARSKFITNLLKGFFEELEKKDIK